jgi:hypothetical protein
MKKLITFIFFFIISIQFLFLMDVKIITIPDNIKPEGNVFKENFIRNLSEVEIYEYLSLNIIDEDIYILNLNPVEIVKLSLRGKLLGRVGKEGQGPGEFLSIVGISKFNGNIAVLDYSKRILSLYTKELKYIKEMRFNKHHLGFFVDSENNFVCFGAGGGDFYFDKYSKDMTHIGNFGQSSTSKKLKKLKMLFDDVRCALYISEDNGIWASFKNRYDIRYYKNQQLSVEIKAKKGFFKTQEENYGGRIVVMCKHSKAICLAKYGNRLFYFFRNNGITFCDIFDLMSYQLLRRIALKHPHTRISHYKKNIFYSLGMDESEENAQLFKLEL